MSMRLYRSGKSQRKYHASASAEFQERDGSVGITATIPSSGWSDRASDFLVEIDPAAFAELAQEMAKVDPIAATKAFGQALTTIGEMGEKRVAERAKAENRVQ